jgi:hypothetical protein
MDSKTFVWSVFGESVIKNIEKNKQDHIYIPFQDDGGTINFLGKNYSLKEIIINKEESFLDDYYL